MAKQLLDDLEIIYSLAPETAINTPYVLTAEFKSGLVAQMVPPIPQLSKIKDDQVGGSNENARKGRNNRWLPVQLPLSGHLNTEIAAVIAKRAFGGTVNNAVVTASTSWDHTVSLQTKAQGRVPALSTFAFPLGGNDFLHASMAVQSFEINFSEDSPVTWAAQLINTGYSWKRLQDISPAIVPPSVPTYHMMHPAGVYVTFNNGSSVDLGASARLYSGRCGLNNDIAVPALPGDPFRVTSPAIDRSSGAYSRDIHRGKRTYTPEVVCAMDETLAEFVTMRDNTDVTNLIFKFAGDLINAADSYEFEIKYPLSTMMVEAATVGNNNAGLRLTFDTDREDAVGGIAILRTRDGVATLT